MSGIGNEYYPIDDQLQKSLKKAMVIPGVDDTEFEIHGAFLLFQPEDILLYVWVQDLANFI